jgi:hypothetical protein
LIVGIGIVALGTLAKFGLDLRGIIQQRERKRQEWKDATPAWSFDRPSDHSKQAPWTYFPPAETPG